MLIPLAALKFNGITGSHISAPRITDRISQWCPCSGSGRRSARPAARRRGPQRARPSTTRPPLSMSRAWPPRATPARAQKRARRAAGKAHRRHSASSGGVSGGRGGAACRGDREGEAPLLTRSCAARLCSLSNYWMLTTIN